MADINFQTARRELVHSGTWGNRSQKVFEFTGDAAAADTIYLGVLPENCSVDKVKVINALGAIADVGYATENCYQDPLPAPVPDGFVADAADATTTIYDDDCIIMDNDYHVFVTATPAAVVAGGTIKVIVDYTYEGHR